MMDDTEKHTTQISDDLFRPLEIEHMSFVMMPKKRAVSLVLPRRADSGMQPLRLVNMSPQTALNLLAWLECERDTLTRLEEQNAPQD